MNKKIPVLAVVMATIMVFSVGAYAFSNGWILQKYKDQNEQEIVNQLLIESKEDLIMQEYIILLNYER